jgi:hypothetical protein
MGGIPQIIKLLDNSNWKLWESSVNAFGKLAARQSSANAFSELAAHRKQTLASLYTFANYLQRSSTKL